MQPRSGLAAGLKGERGGRGSFILAEHLAAHKDEGAADRGQASTGFRAAASPLARPRSPRDEGKGIKGLPTAHKPSTRSRKEKAAEDEGSRKERKP